MWKDTMNEEQQEWYYGLDDNADEKEIEGVILYDPNPSPAAIVELSDPTPLSLEEVA